eukprot:4106055-Karenia_brevis.AAC.1
MPLDGLCCTAYELLDMSAGMSALSHPMVPRYTFAIGACMEDGGVCVLQCVSQHACPTTYLPAYALVWLHGIGVVKVHGS